MLVVAAVLGLVAGIATAVRVDDALAGVCWGASTMAAGPAAVVVAAQLGVAALRGHLDASSRRASALRTARPSLRQDF